jgi:hypothetical protein
MVTTGNGNYATETGTIMKPSKHNPYPTIRGEDGEPFEQGATALAVEARMNTFLEKIDQRRASRSNTPALKAH